MSTWRNPERWQKWVRGDDCPVCRSVALDDALVELEMSRVMMGADAPMRGYVWLAVRRHVVELHELTDDEGAALMRDLRRVSRAIMTVTGAVKLNHEIHGNTVPHLHLHVFPRYLGDRFEGKPIDPRVVKAPVYAPGEFEAMSARVREELARDGAIEKRGPKSRELRFPAENRHLPMSTPVRSLATVTECTLTVRHATATDAGEIARLLTVLGHPTTEDEVAARWPSFVAAGNGALVAAREDGTLGGVATLHHMVVLHRPRPVGRVTALVVDEGLRGQGVGKALMLAAEAELREAGCGLLEITSTARRVDAHAFYERLGYAKTSVRLMKDLTAS